MKSKKKNSFKFPSLGVLVSVLLSFIPAFLFAAGFDNLNYQLKSQSENVLGVQKVAEKYCDSSNFETLTEGLVPEQIEIAKLGLVLNVYSQPLANGTWNVSLNGANYAEGTSTIKPSGGNVGVFGHNSQGIFGKIVELSEGDNIAIYSGKYKANYTVTESFTANPEDIDVFYGTDKPILTLVTCDGAFFEKRYIIRARLEEVEQINCDE